MKIHKTWVFVRVKDDTDFLFYCLISWPSSTYLICLDRQKGILLHATATDLFTDSYFDLATKILVCFIFSCQYQTVLG